MSPKSTVTCFRSPSRALREPSIRPGGADACGWLVVRRAPQSPQNFSFGPFEAPHAVHVAAKALPHSPQKRRAGAFSWAQAWQRIACVPTTRAPIGECA